MSDQKLLLRDLRVIDLRAELERHNLDKSGVRGVLIKRLSKYLEIEGHDPATYKFDLNETETKTTPVKRTRRSESVDEAEMEETPSMEDIIVQDDSGEEEDYEDSEEYSEEDHDNAEEKMETEVTEKVNRKRDMKDEPEATVAKKPCPEKEDDPRIENNLDTEDSINLDIGDDELLNEEKERDESPARKRSRLAREDDRRRRGAEETMRERERRQWQEQLRLVELEKLRAERANLEREKNELLRLEREPHWLELERLELKRAPLRLEEERRKRGFVARIAHLSSATYRKPAAIPPPEPAYSDQRHRRAPSPQRKRTVLAAQLPQLSTKYCTLCDSPGHTLYRCKRFIKQSPAERRSWVSELKLCTRCLRNHSVESCQTTNSCCHCGNESHNSFLCEQGNRSTPSAGHSGTSRPQHKQVAHTSQLPEPSTKYCTYCDIPKHTLYRCKRFLKHSPAERRSWVSELKLCTRCLRNHSVESCQTTNTCCHCGNESHNSFLCEQGNRSTSSAGHSGTSRPQHKQVAHTSQLPEPSTKYCTYCDIPKHTLYRCKRFLKHSPAERRSWVSELKLCTRCLRNHSVESCQTTNTCCHCGNESHNSFLCEQGNRSTSSAGHSGTSRPQHKQVAHTSQLPEPSTKHCTYCDSPKHTLYRCKRFIKHSPAERRSWVSELKLCTRCLRNHSVESCQTTNKCFHCLKESHNSFLCEYGNRSTPSAGHSGTSRRQHKQVAHTSSSRATRAHRQAKAHSMPTSPEPQGWIQDQPTARVSAGGGPLQPI